MQHEEARNYILTRLEQELAPSLYYHSYDHTTDVVRAVEDIGSAEGLNKDEIELLKTAAAFHDSGYLEQYNDNEEIACEYVRQSLPGFDFKDESIEKICQIIMSTRHNIEPRNLLEQVMRDADSDYLGRKDYKRVASNLYKELTEHGQAINEREWITMQISFLSMKHKYYTQTAINSRQAMKERHLERLKEKLL